MHRGLDSLRRVELIRSVSVDTADVRPHHRFTGNRRRCRFVEGSRSYAPSILGLVLFTRQESSGCLTCKSLHAPHAVHRQRESFESLYRLTGFSLFNTFMLMVVAGMLTLAAVLAAVCTRPIPPFVDPVQKECVWQCIFCF